MQIEHVFEAFASSMTQICQYQRTVKQHTNEELKDLIRHKKVASEMPGIKDFSRSTSNMRFNSAVDGQSRSFGMQVLTVDQSFQAAFRHKNKLYQWLLAEAYEAFDKFLTEAYVAVGISDPAFWPLADYGNNHLTELESLGWTSRLVLMKHKKNKVTHILKEFRRDYPVFAKLEKENSLQRDLRVFITLMQKFRHQIVHDGGYIADHEKLVKDILDEAMVVGLKSRGQEAEYINSFMGERDGRISVVLLEVQVKNHSLNSFSIMGLHHDICDGLLKLFVSYAHLIVDCVTNRSQLAADQ